MTQFINDILLSAPSIVIGLFVYSIVVARTRTYSGWAGVLALALIVIPVVVRTTENMLKLIPNALREAAYALGIAEVEGDRADHIEGGPRRCGDRRAAGGGAHRRRNRAAAVHGAVEPVLDQPT